MMRERRKELLDGRAGTRASACAGDLIMNDVITLLQYLLANWVFQTSRSTQDITRVHRAEQAEGHHLILRELLIHTLMRYLGE